MFISMHTLAKISPYFLKTTIPSRSRLWLEFENHTEKGKQFGEIEFPVNDSYKMDCDFPLSFNFYDENKNYIQDVQLTPKWFGDIYEIISKELEFLQKNSEIISTFHK